MFPGMTQANDNKRMHLFLQNALNKLKKL